MVDAFGAELQFEVGGGGQLMLLVSGLFLHYVSVILGVASRLTDAPSI